MRSSHSRTLVLVAWAAVAILGALGAIGGYTAWLGWWGGPTTRWIARRAMPPLSERGMVAVFWSGDLGFNTGMGPRIASRIAWHGIPVLGVNSLTAFRDRLPPAAIDALVRATTQRALARPGARRVVLIGQSFGANALLAGVNALPPGLRARVEAVVFVVPSDTMLYRATPSDILNFDNDGAALPAARGLDWVPVLCIHGATEVGSLCPVWHQPNVMKLTLQGDHYLHHDDGAVARAVLGMIAQTA